MRGLFCTAPLDDELAPFGLRLAIGLALLAWPLVVLLLRCRRALRAPAEQRPAAWAHAFAWHAWSAALLPLAWWLIVPALDLARPIAELLGWSGTALELMPFVLVYVLPPLLVGNGLGAISDWLQRALRGHPERWWIVVRTHLLTLVIQLLPLIGGLLAINAVFTDAWPRLAGIVVGGFVLLMALSLWAQHLAELEPHALAQGALRDRVFAYAEQAGAKLQNLYLLPAGKQQLVNAFAGSAQSVLLSETLVRQLSRRQVDAVVAHEIGHLTHHLTPKWPKWWVLALAIVGGNLAVLAVALAVMFGPAWLDEWEIDLTRWGLALLLLPFHAGFMCWWLVRSRRWEFQADAAAVQGTNDPEALISGLLRLDRLNLMPMRWGWWTEWFLTHPSTARRIDAIARLGKVPAERVAELLANPVLDDAPYELPGATTTPVWSTPVKQRQTLLIGVLLLMVMAGLPVLLVALTNGGGLGLLVGLLLGPGLWLAAQNGLIMRGEAGVERQLRARWAQDGVTGGTFVALSPSDRPVIYEGFFQWDFGLLFVTPERLVYAGDQVRFALPRAQLTRCQLEPGTPNWLPTAAWVCAWDGGHLSLRAAGRGTLTATTEATERLLTPNVTSVPPALADLGPPAWGTITHTTVPELLRQQSLLTQFIWVWIATAAFSTWAGWGLFDDHRTWFALGLSSALAVFARWPLWRQRE